MVSNDSAARKTPPPPVDGALALSSQSGDFIQSRGNFMSDMYHIGGI